MIALLSAVFATANAQTGDLLLRSAHISYAVPSGWVVEDFPDHQGVFTYALVDGENVEASIGIELVERQSPSESGEVLNDFVAETERERLDTARTRIGRSIGQNQSGLAFGRVDYRKFRTGGDLLDSVYVIPLQPRRRLYIYTSLLEDTQAKYKKIIESFLNSISVAR